MPSAYVLYLNDSVVAPALEMVRRVAQPNSRSLPHITVRYPVRRVDLKSLHLYDNARLTQLHLVEPGAFMPNEGRALEDAPKTVFLECSSDELQALEYKPDFPDSVFHVTLFDGQPSEFSRAMYETLVRYPWSLTIDLAPDTHLTRIPIGQRRETTKTPRLSAAASRLLFETSAGSVDAADLQDLTLDERIALIDRACGLIHERATLEQSSQRLATPRGQSRSNETSPISVSSVPQARGQLSLWDEFQANENIAVRRTDRRVSAKAKSLFLTPPEVASEMAQAALAELPISQQIHFGDPSMGNGILYAAFMATTSRTIHSAMGVELDWRRVDTLRRRWAGSGLRVEFGNFLATNHESDRTLILANPPYRRYQELDSTETHAWKSAILKETGIAVDGKADLFVYFLLMAHSWLAPGGVSVWLLPAEFMETNYGRSVREYLTTRVELLRIHVFDRAVSKFENARVSSTVVIFRSGDPDPNNPVSITTGDNMAAPSTSRIISLDAMRASTKWALTATGTLHFDLDRSTPNASNGQLEDLFRIRRGIATGANSYFVISDSKRLSLNAPTSWTKMVVPKSRHLASNVLSPDSNGLLGDIATTWLIDSDHPLEELNSTSPQLKNYLLNVFSEVGERRLVRAHKPFYRQEQVPSPPFFFGYMARTSSQRLPSRFFWNKTDAVILNNYIGLYPSAGLSWAIESGRVSEQEVFDALLELDNSTVELGGRRYVSGLSKSEPGDLKKLHLGRTGRRLLKIANHAPKL